MHLSWIDYAIVLVYVGGTIVAGTLARGANQGHLRLPRRRPRP